MADRTRPSLESPASMSKPEGARSDSIAARRAGVLFKQRLWPTVWTMRITDGGNLPVRVKGHQREIPIHVR